LIAYLLDITRVDPLEYGLLFERFLNEGRIGKLVKEETYLINGELELSLTQKIQILRGSEKLVCLPDELQEGDEILQTL